MKKPGKRLGRKPGPVKIRPRVVAGLTSKAAAAKRASTKKKAGRSSSPRLDAAKFKSQLDAAVIDLVVGVAKKFIYDRGFNLMSSACDALFEAAKLFGNIKIEDKILLLMTMK